MTISLAAEPVFHIGSFPVTNSLLASWIAVAVLAILALLLSRRRAEVPRGLQNVAEAVLEALLGLIDSVTLDRKESKRFFPWIATIFLFVLFANYLGLLPGFGPIGVWEEHEGERVLVPLFRGATADLNTTLALALVSVVTTQVFSILALGVGGFGKRFFNLRNPILSFVGIVEIISEIAKLVSFSFRLFGNIFAGEVLLLVIAFLVPYLVPIPFYFIELFVGFIQALVFALLTLVFLKTATAVEVHEAH